MVSLAKVLSTLTEEQARSVYFALSQWADNTRNFVEEEGEEVANKTIDGGGVKALERVEEVVEKLGVEFVKLADCLCDKKTGLVCYFHERKQLDAAAAKKRLGL